MISLFKKKSFILAIISIAVIIATFLGAFIVTSKENLAKNKKSISSVSEKLAVTQDNSKKSDTTINDNSNNEKAAANKSEADNEKKPNSDTPSAPAPKPVQKSVKDQPANISKNVNSTTKQAQANPQIFVSKNLGFTITFPASWTDKYSIVEEDNGVTVYFKPKNKASNGAGMLFKIVKKSPDIDESTLDGIPGAQRYFTAKNTTFVIGGTTDIGFPDNHPEFNTFKQLKSECPNVLKTLKATN